MNEFTAVLRDLANETNLQGPSSTRAFPDRPGVHGRRVNRASLDAHHEDRVDEIGSRQGGRLVSNLPIGEGGHKDEVGLGVTGSHPAGGKVILGCLSID